MNNVYAERLESAWHTYQTMIDIGTVNQIESAYAVYVAVLDEALDGRGDGLSDTPGALLDKAINASLLELRTLYTAYLYLNDIDTPSSWDGMATNFLTWLLEHVTRTDKMVSAASKREWELEQRRLYDNRNA
jgi:hypothetical protein